MRNMRNRGWQRITAGALVVATCTLEAWAQMSTQDAPMDSIPELVELPDPCNNPTTRMWGSGDELGNMNYLTPERVRKNLSLIRLGKIYDLAHILEPGQMGFVSYHDFRSNLGEWPGKGTSGTIFNNEETLGLSAFNPERAGVLYSSNGTQLDGFTHSTQGGLTYNCFDTRDPANHLLAEGDPGDLPKGDAGSDYPGRPAASHPNPGHVSWLNSGIHMLEDLDLEVLAADCEKERVPSCYAFTLIVQTVPIRGAGGSPVAPTAIR